MSGSSGSGSAASGQQERWGMWGRKRNAFAGMGTRTPYSSSNQGNVIIDPSIRGIQDKGLARNEALYGELDKGGKEIMGNLRGTRSRFEGNQSAYLQSRINPFEQEYTKRQGDLQQSIGLRGISGSSFADQSMNNLATEKQRGMGDVRAQAEMENLQALTGIDAQMAQTMFQKAAQMAQITGMDNETAKARLMQEMQALGLGQREIAMMAQQFENYQQRNLSRNVDHQSNVSYTQSGIGSGGGSG